MSDAPPPDTAQGEADRAARPGTKLGRFVILERLGRGDDGVVYAAYDPELRRRVAIKVLVSPTDADTNPTQEQTSDRLGRLAGEAQALSQLSHPNVVEIYDIGQPQDGEAGAGLFLVMKLIDGPTLDSWLAEDQPGWRGVCVVFAQAAKGLAAAHCAGITHRDFKPRNVIVERTPMGPKATVVDFGLANVAERLPSIEDHQEPDDEVSGGTSRSENRSTADGLATGTPRYMAPEQHRGEDVDPRSDQYALCASLHEALFGPLPWAGLAVRPMADRKRERFAAPNAPGVPSTIGAAVARGLAPQAGDRFSSMAELAATLDGIPRRRQRRRNLAAVAVVAVASVGLYAGWQSNVRHDCENAARVVDGAWNGQRDADLRAHFEVVAPFGETAYRWASGELDRYGESLGQELTASCEATRVTGDQTGERRAVRDACLLAGVDHLDALVGSLRESDRDSVSGLPLAIVGLPSIARCEQLEATQIPSPSARALERRRVHAAVRSELNVTPEVTAELEAIADQAKEAGETALLARTQHALGDTYRNEVRTDDAIAVLEAAVRNGEKAGAQETVTRALRSLAETHRRNDPVRMEELLERTRARLEFASIDEVFAGRLEGSFASVYNFTGRLDEALLASERAYDIMAPAMGTEHPYLSGPLYRKALVLHDLGRVDEAREAYARTLALREAAFGPSHELVHAVLENYGLLELNAGRFAVSKRIYERLHASQVELQGPDAVMTRWARVMLGAAIMKGGEFDRGSAMIEETMRALSATDDQDPASTAQLDLLVAGWYAQEDRAELATKYANHGIAALKGKVEEQHPLLIKLREVTADVL